MTSEKVLHYWRIFCCLLISLILSEPLFAQTSPPGVSPDAGRVVINEIHAPENNTLTFVELYVNESVDTTGWTLNTKGPGGSATGICPLSGEIVAEGAFLLFENDSLSCLDWHPSQREIYLLDSNGSLVYFVSVWHQGNQRNGGIWGDPGNWGSEYDNVLTNLNEVGVVETYCTRPDGELGENNWNEPGESCDPTPGSSNDGDAGILPIVEYRFDQCQWDGTSAEVLDSSGNTLHGTALNGAQTDADGVLGRAGFFDASANQYIRIPHDPLLEMSTGNQVSVSMWIKQTTSQSGWISLLSKSDRSYTMQLRDGQTPRFTIHDGGFRGVDANTPIQLNQWYHLVGTFDGNTVRLYVDGVLQGENSGVG